jgi:hypothetical protein
MAEMILILERNAETGKQNLRVEYGSDADALPMEHEDAHRLAVEELVGRGRITIEREDEGTPELASESQPEQEREQLQSDHH